MAKCLGRSGGEETLARVTLPLLADWRKAFEAAVERRVDAPPTSWSPAEREDYRKSLARALKR